MQQNMVSKAWIKAAILDSLHGNNPPNNESAIAKIWHVLKAKAIAALEKYLSVSRLDLDINIDLK